MITEEDQFQVNKNAPAWLRWEIWSIIRKYEFTLTELSGKQKEDLQIILALKELVDDGTLEVKFNGIERPIFVNAKSKEKI